ncbi:unnamed protein product [Discula destructiva]
MPRYTITEPHPSVAQNSYIHAGRGGAGNFVRAPLTTAPAGVPTPLAPVASNSSTRSFYSGRGGAGNAHSAIDRPMLSFEDEYRRREASSAARGHFGGRGGAGNFARNSNSNSNNDSSSSSKRRTSSSSSAASMASGASSGSEGWRKRLSGVFAH